MIALPATASQPVPEFNGEGKLLPGTGSVFQELISVSSGTLDAILIVCLVIAAIMLAFAAFKRHGGENYGIFGILALAAVIGGLATQIGPWLSGLS